MFSEFWYGKMPENNSNWSSLTTEQKLFNVAVLIGVLLLAFVAGRLIDKFERKC